MTQISSDDVRTLAQLSSLQLDDDDIERLQNDISKTLEYVDQLQTLDTSNVEPTYQLGGQQNVWRDDVVGQSIATSELLKLSPDASNHQIKVPKVL